MRGHCGRIMPECTRRAARRSAVVLAEHNCLACHAREGTREAMPLLPPVLADKLIAVVKRYPDLAPRVAELTPPALNSVGDKLTEAALEEVLAQRGDAHRPYLQVRMPRFPLPGEELPTACATSSTPIARRNPRRYWGRDVTRSERYRLAGGRLVSSEGFGCTSCHAIGSVQPASDSAAARGPDLARLETPHSPTVVRSLGPQSGPHRAAHGNAGGTDSRGPARSKANLTNNSMPSGTSSTSRVSSHRCPIPSVRFGSPATVPMRSRLSSPIYCKRDRKSG